MNAVYDLSTSPANFNFFEFLVCAISHGADHVILDDSKGYKKFKGEILKERMRSILEPGCMLGRCTFSYAGEGHYADRSFDYHISSVLGVYKKLGEIKKLVSVLPPGSEEFTVTIRDYERYPQRNSSQDWRKFAKEVGAYVIEDYAVKKLNLYDRMAIYAGARMNYFVGNGPAVLCFYSDYPHTTFMKNVDVDYHKRHGWHGTQLPWFSHFQKCIWEKEDTYTNIMEEFECCIAS